MCFTGIPSVSASILTNSKRGYFKMNKQDLISKVADKSDISKAKAALAVDAVIEAIKGSLKKGDDVRLVGFGTFSVAKRAATTGRNPRTGEPIKIPASKQPKFKAGKELKEAVNK
jgi:DNA-binding protein HU-beta